MIHIKNLSKHYGLVRAVDNITFDIHTGEILGFLGPNGAGKTTAMRMLTCFMEPTTGDIEINGKSIQEEPLAIKKDIGYLPENTPLYTDMNVLEYLNFVAHIRDIPKGQYAKRISDVIEVTGLGAYIRTNISELSKGFRQRVGLAQAIIHDPKVLVLDEPTTGLDPNQIVEIRNLIKNLGKEKTIILSTHILQEVQATCERVVIIDDGKIVADGSIDELLASSAKREEIYFEVKGDVEKIEKTLDEMDIIETVKLIGRGQEIGKFIIIAPEDVDPRERLFETAVRNEWKILDFHKERANLEDIFMELTQETKK